MENKLMKTRILPFFALLMVAACSDPPPPEAPPQPTAEPAATAAPTVAQTAAPAPPPVVEAPKPKPGKERIVGTWKFSFEGDPKDKAEADAKKKFPKDKDQKKRDAMVQKVADAAAGEWIEFHDGNYISHVTTKGKDKVVLKIKYEVLKDEDNKLTLKPVGKDAVSKKQITETVHVSFKDDDTISMEDPKKKMNLVFKRKP
jgi:hypothetical protein